MYPCPSTEDCWRGSRDEELRVHRIEGHVSGSGSAPLNESSFADGVATVRFGIDAGLTYFDTSPLYGQGMSQAIYGTAFTDQDSGSSSPQS